MNIKIGGYGRYASGNYGVNAIRVDIGNITFYFSYQTCVAIHTYEHGLNVHENVWGPTTGKHLNWIDDGDKKSRLSSIEFDAKMVEILNHYKLEMPRT